MFRTFHIVISGLLFASVASAIVEGAELRTSAVRRPIRRQVSFQQAAFQEALEVPLIIDSVVQAEEFVESCESCGVVGCALDCLVPCNRWASMEYLLWWRRGQNFPPLVTTGAAAAVPPGEAGVLPDATVLFGDETMGEEARPGGRVTIGGWLNDCRTCGIEGRFFALSEEQIRYSADSSEFPVLARPFFEAANMSNEAFLLAHPDWTGPGNVNISSNSNVLGGDFLYRWQAAQSATTKMDFLVGYQFSRIDEDFNIDSFATVINIALAEPGTTLTTSEQFLARNEFHAAQIGLAAAYVNCNWQVDLLAKIAFGNMRQIVTIDGQTTIVTPEPGSTTRTEPGPLAGAANSGRHVSDEFAVAPELGINCRYSITECLDLSFGYSFIYWSSLAQAGRQIDPMLTEPPPAFSLNSDAYWVHGLSAGAHFRF